jgi:hypothetical protein
MKLRTVLVLALPLLLLAGCACGAGVPSRGNDQGSRVTTATPDGVLVLSLRVDPTTASVGETLTATVAYTNTSTRTIEVVGPAGLFYNVSVASADGRVVFDSVRVPKTGPMPRVGFNLAAGATTSGVVPLALQEPGRYSAAAYTLSGLKTPGVTVTIH